MQIHTNVGTSTKQGLPPPSSPLTPGPQPTMLQRTSLLIITVNAVTRIPYHITTIIVITTIVSIMSVTLTPPPQLSADLFVGGNTLFANQVTLRRYNMTAHVSIQKLREALGHF